SNIPTPPGRPLALTRRASSWDHHRQPFRRNTKRGVITRKASQEGCQQTALSTEGPCMSWLDRFLKRKSPLTEPSTEDKSVELREGSAELDEFAARAELDKGHNLTHGASHLANLLNFDPGNRDWMALFDQYFDKSNGDLETLIPRGETLYAATEAMRALIWQRHGRLADAVELMFQVTPVTHAKYLHEWVLAWVEPDGAIESLP